jgi:putative salt-induced outer membrane protein YdiY
MRRMIGPFWIAVLFLFAGHCARADTVFLRNGDRITGRTIAMVEGVLKLDVDYAGSIALPWRQVDALFLDEPMPVLLADGTQPHLAALPTRRAALSDVVAIALPLPQPPRPTRWEGRVDFGYTLAEGNRNTQLGTLTVLAQRKRNPRSVVSLLLDAARASTEGEKTADRARVEAKLDRGTDELSYRYFLTGAGYDRLRDLDLRLEVGSGLGRTLLQTQRNLATAELGVSYVRDSFGAGETQQDAKLRLGQAWKSTLAEHTSLRQSLALLSAFGDLHDYTGEFVLALSHQLSERLAITFKIVDSYDSRPAPDTQRNDLTFATQLGMTFGP